MKNRNLEINIINNILKKVSFRDTEVVHSNWYLNRNNNNPLCLYNSQTLINIKMKTLKENIKINMKFV